MLTIREARADDVDAIIPLSQHLQYKESSQSEAHLRLNKLIESSDHWVYVAESVNSEQEKGIVGWLHCFHALRLASESFYEIGGMVVCPSARRLGVGKLLVDHAMSSHSGKWRVRCSETRKETHQFYENVGFTTCKTQCVFEKYSE